MSQKPFWHKTQVAFPNSSDNKLYLNFAECVSNIYTFSKDKTPAATEVICHFLLWSLLASERQWISSLQNWRDAGSYQASHTLECSCTGEDREVSSKFCLSQSPKASLKLTGLKRSATRIC